MPSFVYILGAVSGARALTYVGWTTDLSRRLKQHNGGIGACSTRGRQWVLLYSESCNGKRHAMSREWHLKRDRSLRRRLLQTLSAPALTAR
jgi:putative endonuclease